jgi:8-oxo-dGTP diphosphatase
VNNHIAVIDHRDVDPMVSIDERPSYYVRHAARAVIADDDGNIALIYAKQRNYYKLPGGGIEEGEDIHEALRREIMEEIGCNATIGDELGTVEEWRDFQEMHQISHCFVAQIVGSKGAPAFTESEAEEGFEVVWAEDIDAAIKLVESIDDAVVDNEVISMTRRDAAILHAANSRAT